MKVLLVCPSTRTSAPLLAESTPLAARPLLGQSVLEYWLTHIAGCGAKEAIVLADDRPDYIRAIAGTGTRWGLNVTVIEESRELTPAQALLKYDKDFGPGFSQDKIIVLDHFPNSADKPLFSDYAAHFESLLNWMSHARTPDRVGVKELMAGLYTGLRAHVSADAKLQVPCWLGKNVYVGAGASVGPRTIVEDGSFIESGAVVSNSFVGPDTFVGKFAELSESFAQGDTLVNLRTGSVATVPDNFLLSALRQPRPPQSGRLLERLADLCSRHLTEVQLLWKNFLMKKEG
jgi:NDP-sugar pyrophosphorylase family protein